MHLITIAHRGEAQEFIRNLDLKADQEIQNLYKNNDLLLFISGEGIYEVLVKLPYLLAKFPIQTVSNYGIAGALDNKLKIDEVYPIKTALSHNGQSARFHSFETSCTQKAAIDCISTDKRVLDDDYARSLSGFAPIVDRELWGIGKVCREYNIPFISYKLISDYAGKDTQCFDIKNQALNYSQLLFTHYITLHEPQRLESIKIKAPIPMSFSHQQQFNKQMQILIKRENQSEQQILQKVNIDKIKQMDIRPKAKASMLLEVLDRLVNPINIKVKEELNTLFLPFSKIGASIKIDPKLETKKLTLKMDINDQKNLDRLKLAIDEFSYQRLEDIWNGDFDV